MCYDVASGASDQPPSHVLRTQVIYATNKSLVALTSAALAQSSVKVYGRIDQTIALQDPWQSGRGVDRWQALQERDGAAKETYAVKNAYLLGFAHTF